MDYSICSRETERDYTWDNTHASHPVEEYARGFFAPAFEGSMTTSRFAALLRCPGSPDGVMLCISVSTPRRDFRHRPIRTMAFLRAETEQETDLLSAFFAECLRTETLDDEESPVARAVEGIYQTKGLEEFTGFCRSLPQVERHKGVPPTGRYELPRNGTADRQALSESLSALVEGDKPFLAVLTDREPAAVLESLGSLFDHGTVHIFSKEVSEKKKLPEKGAQSHSFRVPRWLDRRRERQSEIPGAQCNETYSMGSRAKRWGPAFVALLVACVAIFVTYREINRKYVVQFVDADGTVISSAEYANKTAAVDIARPADPTKVSTVQFTYTFAGWSPAVADVRGEATYTATYREEVNRYTVRFVDENGTIISAAEYPYGTPAAKIKLPPAPTKPATAQFTYTFAGWSPAVADVRGEATYKATYRSTDVQPPAEKNEDSTSD